MSRDDALVVQCGCGGPDDRDGHRARHLSGTGAGPLPAEQVIGIGGVFFKAKDPKGLTRWYREHLGIDALGTRPAFAWREHDDPSRVATTVWTVFPDTTTYFSPGTASFMVNYRVRSLDRMLAQLCAHGVTVEPRITDETAGRFAWVVDLEGNRIELWEPKSPE